jgi:leader peptidase (prepilin peptidase)/N-methyltransferase
MEFPAAALALGVAGGAWGLVSDRIASRWPAHEDGSRRAPGWRTLVAVATGTLAGLGLALGSAMSSAEPAAFAFLGIYAVALVLLLATDLDQRLLPDVITLPLIVYALAGAALSLGPYVSISGAFGLDVAAAIGLPAALFAVSIPFGRGAIGVGDLKLLVSVGLLAGAGRAVIGLATGVIGAAVVILVLLVLRRITLRSYVPYGPFLILGVLWAILGPGSGFAN